MIYFDVYQNFNINRILLILVGLWPYQDPKIARLQQYLICSVLLSFLTFQLTTFVTTRCTSNLILKVWTNAFIFINYVVGYNAFWYKIALMKYLLEELQQAANELRNENEIAIIEKYAYKGKCFTITLTLIGILYILAIQPLWMWALTVPSFVNGSQTSRSVQIMTEYFVDKEKYRFLILLHMNAAFCMGALTAIAVGTTYLGYFHYICGMFKIASYRIENAMKVDSQQGTNLKKDIMIYKGIIYAIDIHRKAMKFVTIFLNNFEMLLCAAIGFVVICLSLSLYRILTFEYDIAGLLLNISYATCLLLFMFLANYIGQEITDHNNHIFLTTYNTHWYIASLHIQKIILLLLQRGTKPFVMNIGNLFVASLECFASVKSRLFISRVGTCVSIVTISTTFLLVAIIRKGEVL